MSDMDQLTFLSEEALANLSPLQGVERVLKENPASCTSIFEQFATSCEHRGGAGPRYIVWENVPGCLSSNKGRDFGCLLDELEECGYFVAWRTLDSQFTRVFDRASGRFRGPVPQRRRRVYLVGSLGGPGAEEILFERSCLRGDYPKGQQAREAFTRDFVQGPRLGDRAFGFCGYASSTAGTIGFDPVSMTLKEGGGFQTQVPTAVISFTGEHGGDTTMGLGENLAPTVSAKHAPSICMESGQARATIAEDVATTLNAEHEQPIVIDRAAFNQGGGALYAPHIEQTDVMDTLVARGPHAVCHRTASR